MAKRKHTTALFEVYRQSVSHEEPRKPGWAQRAVNWLRRGINSGQRIWPKRTTAQPEPPSTETPRKTEVAEIDGGRGMRFDFVSDDQTIRIVLSYSSAAVIAFALLVLIALAYLTGRHSSQHPLPLLAERTTEQIRQGKPDRSVLDVTSSNLSTAIPPAAAKPSAKPQTWNDSRLNATYKTEDDEPRQIGLNYVIIQTYPNEKNAQAARDLLRKNGINCTVEPPPPGWWRSRTKVYSVIGTTGFDRIHCPEFERYIASIMKVSKQFAGHVRYNRFNPSPYLWRKVK